MAIAREGTTAIHEIKHDAPSHSDGLNYVGAAFITLGGDERKEFLAEVERLTTSWGVFKSSRATQRW